MSSNMMLAAYCRRISQSGEAKDKEESDELIANYELRKCKRPTLFRDGSSKIHEYPPGTVLVRTLAASICGSDLFGLGGCKVSPTWRRPTDLLAVMQERCGGSGHEAIGEIADISGDPDSLSLSIGQKVLAMPSTYIKKVSSMSWAFTKETGLDANDVFQEEHGAFAEYFISHQCVCIPLPEKVPNESFDWRWYVMAQPLGTILNACAKLGSVINCSVAVVGAGQNGLIMTQMLAKMGARHIIVLDLLEDRLIYSTMNNATHTIEVKVPINVSDITSKVASITNGRMCDVTLDMVGHQSNTILLCSELTKEGGNVLLFGLPPAKEEDQMSIRYVDLTRNLKYICAHSPAMEYFQLALEMIEQGRFDPSSIFSHKISFGDFVDGYNKACNYEDRIIKLLITF